MGIYMGMTMPWLDILPGVTLLWMCDTKYFFFLTMPIQTLYLKYHTLIIS